MFELIKSISREGLDLLEFVAAAVYLGLVAIRYATEGPHYHFRFDVDHPYRSTERLAVGWGVRVAARILRVLRALLDMLYEASAEVGDWATQHASAETQARLRSHFL